MAGKSFPGVRGSAPGVGPAKGPATRALGNTTKNPSSVALQRLRDARDAERRAERWKLQETVRRISHLPRVCACRRRRIKADFDPSIRVQAGRAHYAGVQLCGSIWVCPNCGPKIRQRRAEEIERALVAFMREPIHWGEGDRRARACPLAERDQAKAGTVLLLTLTMPHDFGEGLRPLLRTISKGFEALVSGRRWWDDCDDFGLVGYIRAHDSTHGANGWHPHFHVVLLARDELTPSQLRQLRRRLYVRWAKAIAGRRRKLGRRGDAWEGQRRLPSYRHGLHIEPARSVNDVARYAAEIAGDIEAPPPPPTRVVVGERTRLGLELTRQDLKRGTETSRTPWEILRAIAYAPTTCDEDGVVTESPELRRDLRLWSEWESETHGKQAMRWSAGLKRVFAVAEKTDEEIAAEEIGGETVHQFNELEWWAVWGTDGAPGRMLALAETDPEEMRRYLAAIVATFVRQKRHLPRAA